jgi:uncharacterized protein YaiI (UPF0178 family)
MTTQRPGAALRMWVDADACPRDIRDIVMRAAVRRGLAALFVANTPVTLPPYPELSSVLVPSGPDAADDHIVAEAANGDVVITGDIPLAARLVERRVMVLDTRGEELTEATIGERLAMRNLMEDLRSAGQITGGPKEFSPTDRQRFANALDRFLTRRCRPQ